MKTAAKKQELLKIAKDHRKADRFIQGQWLNGEVTGAFSGCFFGCMTQSEDNTLEKAAEVFEWPLWLVHVAEKIFEGLPPEDAVEFPVQLIKASRAGKNHEQSYKDFFYKMLMDKKHGQITFVEKDSEQCKAIVQCAELFKMDVITRSAAESAAGLAARSAAEPAARSAWYAAESAAWSAAESAHYQFLRDVLIESVK